MQPSYIGVLASAMIGSAIAALADLLQKDSASAVYAIQTALAKYIGAIPALWPILILMMIGVALCFVFQPKSRQTGFALGLSVISVLMTATPVKLPSSPAAIPEHADIGQAGHLAFADSGAAGRVRSDLPLWLAQAPTAPNIVKVNFNVTVNEQSPPPLGAITIAVREMPDGKVWTWTTEQFAKHAAFPLTFFYNVPMNATTTSIEARLESENYGTVAVTGPVSHGVGEIGLTFALEKSSVPNFIKRIFDKRGY